MSVRFVVLGYDNRELGPKVYQVTKTDLWNHLSMVTGWLSQNPDRYVVIRHDDRSSRAFGVFEEADGQDEEDSD